MTDTDSSHILFTKPRDFVGAIQPLYRNAYALMFSTGFSSALGMIYWIIAARFYSAETVGLNSAQISLMILLSGVAQFDLMSAMTRYIPQAGRSTRRLIRSAYLVSLAAAAILTPLVLWAMQRTNGVLAVRHPLFILSFILGTMVWGIFNLQDTVLAGLRETHWVPITNIFYAVVKILLLVGFAFWWPQYGIFASWTIPVILLVVPINILIFRRMVPRHASKNPGQTAPIVPVEIARFVAGNYVGSLFMLAATRLLPVLVTHIQGAAANAYFFVAWSIANSIHLTVTTMAVSLTVEGSTDPQSLYQQSARFLRHVLWLFVPVTIVLIIAAPWILRVSGTIYEREATVVFRVLLLATLPHIVTALYLSIARVRKQVREIIIVQGGLSLLTLALSYLLLPVYGITGPGIALLAAESLVAFVLLFTGLRPALRAAH